jgi:hypothetical protein
MVIYIKNVIKIAPTIREDWFMTATILRLSDNTAS